MHTWMQFLYKVWTSANCDRNSPYFVKKIKVINKTLSCITNGTYAYKYGRPSLKVALHIIQILRGRNSLKANSIKYRPPYFVEKQHPEDGQCLV